MNACTICLKFECSLWLRHIKCYNVFAASQT